MTLAELENEAIRQAIKTTGSVAKASEILGLSAVSIYARMKNPEFGFKLNRKGTRYKIRKQKDLAG